MSEKVPPPFGASQLTELLQSTDVIQRQIGETFGSLDKHLAAIEPASAAIRRLNAQLDIGANALRVFDAQSRRHREYLADLDRSLAPFNAAVMRLATQTQRLDTTLREAFARSNLDRLFVHAEQLQRLADLIPALRPLPKLLTADQCEAALKALSMANDLAATVARIHSAAPNKAVVDSILDAVAGAEPKSSRSSVESIDGTASALELMYSRLAAWYESQPPHERAAIALALSLIREVIIGLLVAYVAYAWLDASDREARLTVAQVVNLHFTADLANGLRCVRGRGINVRNEPSTYGAIIGRLEEHHTVEVLEHARGFSRIRYIDPASGELREGWAASGYLLQAPC